MRYEPIKDKLGKLVGESPIRRRILYFVLGSLFLREWHVKRELRKILRENKIKNVLDAGSGFGQYAYYICKKMSGRSLAVAIVCGVDVNREEIDKCNAFAGKLGLRNLSFTVADLEKLDFRDEFDLIVSVDVMEHIRDDVAVFRNFFSSLRKGGKILISTPSKFGGSDVHEEGEHSFIEEHFREGYSAEEITSKLESANVRVESIHYTYGRVGSWYWNLSIKIPVKLLNRSFLMIFFLPFYYLIALPFSFLFMAIDYFFPPKRGSGLLVVASKA